jgi:hypothetical protein
MVENTAAEAKLQRCRLHASHTQSWFCSQRADHLLSL